MHLRCLSKWRVETGEYEVIHDFGFVSELSISFSAEGGELEYATWVDDKPEIKIFNKSKESSILAGFMKSFDSFNVSVTSIDDNNENIMLHVAHLASSGSTTYGSRQLNKLAI